MGRTSRTLRIYRDGRKYERELFKPIPSGAKGNLETLGEMKKIVVSDAKENDLRNFVNREIIGFDKWSLSAKVDAIFLYARDRIRYEPETDGFETVADLWSCLYAFSPETAVGDCVQKSIFIATCLSYLGLKPNFVAIQQIPNVDYFNHVFVNCEINGQTVNLDATPKEFRVGDAANYLSKLVFPIF